MKITFLIGNGYDLNIGLKTGYASFLEWYLQQPSSEEYIPDFKKLIHDGIDYWSDLEIALGKNTLHPPLNTKNGFKVCKTDLDVNLNRYLKDQNSQVRFPSQDDIDCFRKSIVSFRTICSSQTQDKLKAIYNKHKEKEYEYNIVDFNFTNTVDLFWNILPDDAFWHNIFYPKLYGGMGFRTFDKKGKLFHIHGTLNDSMMTGLDNPSQMTNTIFQRTDLINSLCVKPIMNENSKRDVEKKVEELIDTTTIFVVYGMSIGLTDAKWWKRIVRRLLSEENTYLLIVNYDKDYNPVLPYTSSLISKKILNNLMCISGCPEKYQETLKAKADILLNTDLFKFSSLLPMENEEKSSFREDTIGAC